MYHFTQKTEFMHVNNNVNAEQFKKKKNQENYEYDKM